MKHDLIKTDDYLLVVDESEIKEGDWLLSKEGTIHNNFGWNFGDKKIISHLPLNDSPILEGVDLLPPLEEDDVEKLADKYANQFMDGRDAYYGYKEGYNKAKEKYKYTEEDLRNALFYALYHPKEDGVISITKDFIVRKSIQSLSQPKIPIGFQCEMEDKIALDGHTIIGIEPITTTTPEGHTQWVGTYIFN
jgi:hypothetical protein